MSRTPGHNHPKHGELDARIVEALDATGLNWWVAYGKKHNKSLPCRSHGAGFFHGQQQARISAQPGTQDNQECAPRSASHTGRNSMSWWCPWRKRGGLVPTPQAATSSTSILAGMMATRLLLDMPKARLRTRSNTCFFKMSWSIDELKLTAQVRSQYRGEDVSAGGIWLEYKGENLVLADKDKRQLQLAVERLLKAQRLRIEAKKRARSEELSIIAIADAMGVPKPDEPIELDWIIA